MAENAMPMPNNMPIAQMLSEGHSAISMPPSTAVTMPSISTNPRAAPWPVAAAASSITPSKASRKPTNSVKLTSLATGNASTQTPPPKYSRPENRRKIFPLMSDSPVRRSIWDTPAITDTAPTAMVSKVAETNGSTTDSPAAANSRAAVTQRRAGEAGTVTGIKAISFQL